ncbi:holo-ACP synthase [Thiobacter aerophilum]|uniref:Holo-[acyl-carrier-protein] synthase n=1 Tax=Thiobacter aerophilum TaxID=3121275 RepID=A0ABV0EAH6_9BURK
MAIYGIGTDIVDVRRMAAILARHGARVARRLLSPSELPEFALAPFPERFLAKRFAAKEAFAKAAGTGFRHPVSLSRLCITHDALGKPGFAWDATLGEWLAARGILACHLSVSDEKELVAAFVILERAP